MIERLDFERNQTKDSSGRAALVKHVGAESGQAFQAERKVEFETLFKAMLLGVGHHAVGQLLGLGRSHLRQVERHQMAVHTNLGRRVGGDVQIAAVHLQHSLEQIA